ncbi:hypothetical protein [Anaerofustis sp.]|uniref:hypothetical protein n=1 Tax=Anaerofustis sp. TaxID=1872517 RepID=UPI0025C622DE|nr:hypothetical protein [Anaerofustis sp.]
MKKTFKAFLSLGVLIFVFIIIGNFIDENFFRYSVEINDKNSKNSNIEKYYCYINDDNSAIILACVSDDLKINKNIASIYPRYLHYGPRPRIIQNKDNVYIIYSGLNYKNDDENIYYDDDKKYCMRMFLYKNKPVICNYNFFDNKIHDINIKNKHDTILLDGVMYKNEYINIFEKNKTPLYNINERWSKTTGYINNKKLDHPIVGVSALNIKGCLVDNIYYYPALDGIYAYNLDNDTDKKMIDLDLRNCEDVYLIQNNQNFILIKENIPLIKNDEYIGIDVKANDTGIIKFDSQFKVINSIRLNNDIEDVTIGQNGFVITYGTFKNGHFELGYKYINFESLKEDILYERNIKLDDDSFTELHFPDIDKYLYKCLFMESKKSFIFIDTNKHEIDKVVEESGILK